MPALPLPRPDHEVVVVPAPGRGPGHWAGAPSAALDADGAVVLAYRVRTAERRGSEVVIARPGEPAVRLGKDRFGAESLERPALVRTEAGWRLYVSCATPGTKHWRIDVLEAADPAGLAAARARGRKGGAPFKMTAAKVRLALAAMGQPKSKVADLCRELGITRQTLYRHVSPEGALREDGRRLLNAKRTPPAPRGVT
jgi:hypothetical protein